VRPVSESGDPPNTPLEFRAQDLDFTIDFCYGMPADPYYPEGVVAALLRGGNPPATTTPTGDSFLTTAGKESPDRTTCSRAPSVFPSQPFQPRHAGGGAEQSYPCPGMTPFHKRPGFAREQIR
jgi:hypothetical protein